MCKIHIGLKFGLINGRYLQSIGSCCIAIDIVQVRWWIQGGAPPVIICFIIPLTSSICLPYVLVIRVLNPPTELSTWGTLYNTGIHVVTENHGCHQLSQDHPLEIGHEMTNQINQINQIKTRSTRSTRSATEEKHGFQLIFVVKSLESACEDDSFSFTVGMFNRHLCLHDIKVINCWVLIMI